jgi:hypothetical protein
MGIVITDTPEKQVLVCVSEDIAGNFITTESNEILLTEAGDKLIIE